MRRREFLGAIGGVAAWPVVARAQSGKTWRIGLLETSPLALNASNIDALKNGLRELGYVEGQNLVIEYRSADGHAERFRELAVELLRLRVDLIITRGTPAALAAKNATATIPVVMAASGEPVGAGVIASLARPGANVTGLSAFTTELEPKRVELLREVVPKINRLAAVYNMSNPVLPPRWEILKAVTRSLGIEQPQLFDVRASVDLERAFETMASQSVDAVVVENDGLIHANRQSIVNMAARHKLPAVYATREMVDEGGLMSYSVNYAHLYFRTASFVNKVFKGTKPSELPVEQPTKFELIFNLKTAKSIGLKISDSFLLRADEVIE